MLVVLKLTYGDKPDIDDTRVLIVPSVTDNRGNGALLDKLMSTMQRIACHCGVGPKGVQ